MNITTDLHYAFFTLKNRRSQKDQKLSLGPAPGDENELYEQTEEEKYKLFEPSINYFLGIYLSIIGMSSISVVSMGSMAGVFETGGGGNFCLKLTKIAEKYGFFLKIHVFCPPLLV